MRKRLAWLQHNNLLVYFDYVMTMGLALVGVLSVLRGSLVSVVQVLDTALQAGILTVLYLLKLAWARGLHSIKSEEGGVFGISLWDEFMMYEGVDFLRRTRFLYADVLSTSWPCVKSRNLTSQRERRITGLLQGLPSSR